MYLCNYNQKNVRKNTFLWAIGKNPFVYEVLYYVYVHVHWDFVC